VTARRRRATLQAMRTALLALLAASLAGCPNKSAPTERQPEVNRDPYKNVTPEKVKAKVEAAQKREEDRDDKILDKAKE